MHWLLHCALQAAVKMLVGGGTIDSPDSTEKTEAVQQEETEKNEGKKEEKKEKGDTKEDNKKAIKKNDKVAKTMEITKEMLEYFSEDNAPIYSFERSAKAPGKNVEYEEKQSPDSDETVYMWAENKMGQCRVMYYSEAYSIEMDLSAEPFSKSESLAIVELPEGVTEIPLGSFRECGNLAKVIIPESVKEIGESAFEDCSSLRTVEIPDNVEQIGGFAFRNSGLQSVTLPPRVKCVELRTFEGCKELASVTLNKDLEEIGDLAFTDCSSLRTVEIPDNVEQIGVLAFSNSGLQSVTLPPRLKCVEEHAFACEELASVTLNEGLERIGIGAFAGTAITELTLPSTLKEIWHSAFSGCSNLTSVSLNEGLESIGSSAFYWCPNMVPLSLPSTLKKLEIGAFDPKIVGGQLPEGLETISGRLNENVKVNSHFVMDENGVIFNKDRTAILATTKDLEGEYRIPDGIVSIGAEAFKSQMISGIVWNQELEEIGTNAFASCGNLTSVPPVPSGVKELNSTFRGCKNLQEIVVPGTVEKLAYTFQSCKNLTSLTLEEGIKEIDPRTFDGCEKLQNLVYPKGVKIN